MSWIVFKDYSKILNYCNYSDNLVGALEHEFHDFPETVGNGIIIPTDSQLHHFSEGLAKKHQPVTFPKNPSGMMLSTLQGRDANMRSLKLSSESLNVLWMVAKSCTTLDG